MSFAGGILEWMIPVVTVVLTIAFALDFTRRRHAVERIGHAPQILRMMVSLSPRRRVIKAVMIVVAMTLVTVALARPQVEGKATWHERGIDVAVVMDYSKSMLARDVYPSRLQRTEIEVDELLDALRGNRVAVVAFAGATAHFPLTSDFQAARVLFRGLTPYDMPPGSDIGQGLTVARCLLRPGVLDDPECSHVGGRGRGGAPLGGGKLPPAAAGKPKRSDRARAIVLFTDGEDTAGHARAEVERAVMEGIHVYVVGVGTVAGELIPDRDASGHKIWKKTKNGKFVVTHLNESGLKALARSAGGEGHYFHLAPKSFHLHDLVGKLQRLRQGDIDERAVRDKKHVYQWFLFPAFLLLVIEGCMSERRRRPRAVEERKEEDRR